ncbi:MAG: FAD-binding oxidoreductase [Myxococcota bacterium]
MMTSPTTTAPYWYQQPSFSIPTLSTDVDADVCVVGLGGSGLAAVHALLDAGQSVVGVDAHGIASGAAGRNGGFLIAGAASFHHQTIERVGRPAALALYRLTQAQLKRMAEETPNDVQLGFSLRRADDAEELEDCRAEMRALEHDDIAVEWYDGPEGQGIAIPGDGVFHPHQRALSMARRALERGARLFVDSPALEVSGREVHTPKGRVRCRAVIVAADAALARILPELDGRIYDVRLQMLATLPDPSLKLRAPVYSRYGYDYWQQRPDGQIVVGGGRHIAGDTELTNKAEVTPVVMNYLTKLLRDDIGSQAEITHRWAGIVGYTQDSFPILEEVRPGVMAAGGYCGTGNLLGRMAGRDAAARIVGGEAPLFDLLQQLRAAKTDASKTT